MYKASLLTFSYREDDRFDQFANISASAGLVTQKTLNGLRNFIQESLNTREPSDSIANIISEGGFGTPTRDVSDLTRDSFLAALAAPGISSLWATAGIVVLKASSSSLGFDPCEGNRLFNANEKRCNTRDGAMYVVRSQGRENFGVNLQQKENFDVPGLFDAGLFGITPQDVTIAAERIQGRTNKFYGAPGEQETADSIVDGSRITIQNVDALFFNLPFCDMDSVRLNERQERTCDLDRFADSRDMCRFNLLMNCACPNLRVGGDDWPFQRGSGLENVNCFLETA
jgi:hypothetical protein